MKRRTWRLHPLISWYFRWRMVHDLTRSGVPRATAVEYINKALDNARNP